MFDLRAIATLGGSVYYEGIVATGLADGRLFLYAGGETGFWGRVLTAFDLSADFTDIASYTWYDLQVNVLTPWHGAAVINYPESMVSDGTSLYLIPAVSTYNISLGQDANPAIRY